MRLKPPTPLQPLRLSRWEAVGPFPAGMREHPLTSAPLSAFGRFDAHNNPVDPEAGFAHAAYGVGDWPSELPTGGRAGWATFKSGDGTKVEVAYPDVNWAQLRADHGWAALQYTVLLRIRLTIPQTHNAQLTRVLIDAPSVVEYAFVPSHDKDNTEPSPLKWYPGDMYAYCNSPSGTAGTSGPSNYARALALPHGEYVLLVRALYECRMFGDPGDVPPTIVLGMRVFVDPSEPAEVRVLEGATVVPDLMDGWALGAWMSVSVAVPPTSTASRDTGGEEGIEREGVGNGERMGEGEEEGLVIVRAEGYGDGLTLGTMYDIAIAPGQTRAIPLRLAQLEPTSAQVLSVVLTLTRGVREWTQVVDVPLKHVSSPRREAALMTYASPHGGRPAAVSTALVLPPPSAIPSPSAVQPVLLALHGAGVPTPSEEWVEMMPSIAGMWALLPSGRNEWGEDWHGASAADVWAARDALNSAVGAAGHTISDETVLIGHSNGGQGAWHAAARFPDRVRGVVAVAGYTKIQDYVPYTALTGSHYADPALMGVLLASLAPYNNDLYVSNLAGVPVLAVHGAEDDNVPPRHGRAQCGLVAAWSGSVGGDVTFVEVPDAGHVWPGVLRHPAILEFINTLPPKKTTDEVRKEGFTLATANPDESGSKAGIRIAELAVPGRLARLDVNARQWCRDGCSLDLHGTNVRRVEVVGWGEGLWSSTERALVFEPRPSPNTPIHRPRPYGPLMRLLASPAPVTLVVPSGNGEELELATTYAHDLRVYHRLEACLMRDREALRAVVDGSIGPGNVVVFGTPQANLFAAWMVAQKSIPVEFPARGVLAVEGRVVWEDGTGIITLHPHPTTPSSLACLVAGNDVLGLQLAARLLPLRTGVPVPDWAVVGPRMRWQAAGGLVGAGFWGAEWGWSEAMSWFDRE